MVYTLPQAIKEEKKMKKGLAVLRSKKERARFDICKREEKERREEEKRRIEKREKKEGSSSGGNRRSFFFRGCFILSLSRRLYIVAMIRIFPPKRNIFCLDDKPWCFLPCCMPYTKMVSSLFEVLHVYYVCMLSFPPREVLE